MWDRGLGGVMRFGLGGPKTHLGRSPRILYFRLKIIGSD